MKRVQTLATVITAGGVKIEENFSNADRSGMMTNVSIAKYITGVVLVVRTILRTCQITVVI